LFFGISYSSAKEWFERYLRLDNDYVFIIEETVHLYRPIGQISLDNVDLEDKRAELGRLMIGDDEALGEALAKRATRLLVEVSFDRLELAGLYLEVLKENSPAIAIYKACGFQSIQEDDRLIKMRLFNSSMNNKR
jgi:RimJ/RimL family protein N-acetyltransferase